MKISEIVSVSDLNESLRDWFKQDWVRFGPDGKIRGDCARGDDSEGKPKCLPRKKAHALGKKGRKYAAAKKRREDPDPERRGKAKNVATKKKSNEDVIESAKRCMQCGMTNCSCPAGSCKCKPIEGWIPGKGFQKKGVAEGSEQISIQVRKGRSKFATELSVDGKPAGAYQYDADSGRSIAEVYPEYKGKGFGKILVLHAIYTAAKLGMDFVEDESRTAEYDNVLDSLDSNGLAVNDDGYWYVTGEGEHFLKQRLKQGVAEEQLDELKCWPGYHRVKGTKAGFPGSCAKNTSEGVEDDKCPHCGGDIVPESQLHEKKDACYHKVKARYKVWPSAYASGALVQCRKKGAKNWGERLKQTGPVLSEGGNIWKDDLSTIRINRADVLPTVKFLEKVTGLPLVPNMLGSTGRKDTSGDLDLAVDANTVDKAQLETKLKAWAAKKDPTALTKKTGVSVHFRTPIKGDPKLGYVQTDFMFMPDVEFSRWAMEANPSKFKGADRHIIMASLAKFLGLKWSFKEGLTVRDTGTPLAGGRDKDTVAKILLGPTARAEDLNTVESILAKVKTLPDADAMLADFRDHMSKSGISI